MSTSDQELLDFSESILVQGVPEATLRASISRGYYGVYHKALELANTLRLPLPDKATGSHEKLILRLKGIDDGTLQAMLRKAKMMRVGADYKLSQDVTYEESSLHLASCKRLAQHIAMIKLVNQ